MKLCWNEYEALVLRCQWTLMIPRGSLNDEVLEDWGSLYEADSIDRWIQENGDLFFGERPPTGRPTGGGPGTPPYVPMSAKYTFYKRPDIKTLSNAYNTWRVYEEFDMLSEQEQWFMVGRTTISECDWKSLARRYNRNMDRAVSIYIGITEGVFPRY